MDQPFLASPSFHPLSTAMGAHPSPMPGPEASWSGRRILSACLLLASRMGRADEAVPIAAALERELGDARAVKVLVAVGALLGGNAAVGQAELASEQHSGQADAATLVFAMVDRLAGGQHQWQPLVQRVLATSSDPTWRAVAYAIEQLG